MSNTSAPALSFDGSNWEDLTRLVTQSTLARLLESEINSDADQCAWLARHFSGPAIDWVGVAYTANPLIFENFGDFCERTRQQFGVSDEGLEARRRGQLEALKWSTDLPVFFAEFDRLTTLCSLHGDAVRIALLRNKLPVHTQKLLAEQALDFHNYDTMRERLLTMWALDPNKSTAVHASPQTKRPRCGRCGKKGHTASDCRGTKN